MKDPEFIEMKRRFITGMIIVLLFAVPFLIFISRKFLVETSPIIKGINNNETMLVYVEKNNCKNCNMVKDELDSLSLKYYKINSTSDKNYLNILHRLDITTTDIAEPTLIYIKEGKYFASLPSIKDENEVMSFLVIYGFVDSDE